MRRIRVLSLTIASIGWATLAFGQDRAFHVFPQVVDGKLSDGSSYYSILSITNLGNASSTCSLSTSLGFPVDRFLVSAPRTLPPYTSILNITQNSGVFVSGYAMLNCTQPVQASLMYAAIARDGSTQSMATVFSAPPISYAGHFVLTGLGLKYALAIANPSGAPINVDFTLNRPDATNTTRTVSVPARSRLIRFIDEVIPLPNGLGASYIEISSTSQFHLTSLLYDGGLFTTLIPATMP